MKNTTHDQKHVFSRDGDISMSYQYIDIFKFRMRYDILFYISIYFRYFTPVIKCYLFHLLLSHLMGLNQNLKNAYIFVLHNFLDVFR